MAEINVTFTHPVDRRSILATVDDSMTADEVIVTLGDNDVIRQHDSGYYYMVQINDGMLLQGSATLANAGVKDGMIKNTQCE